MAYQPYQAPFMAYNPAVNPAPSAAYPSPNYQQMVYEPPKYAQPQSAGGTGVIWVQGEAGAKSYLVAPGATVMLMDSESQRFYLKSTDNAGMPAMRIFEYNEVFPNVQTAAPTSINPDASISQETLNDMTRQLEELRGSYKELSEKVERLTAEPKRKTVKAVENDA